MAARNGRLEIVERLLGKKKDGSYEFPDVVGDIAARSNYALRWAAENGHLAIVERLLGKKEDGTHEFPAVVCGVAANNNEALRLAARNSHHETSCLLAQVAWPSISDMPEELKSNVEVMNSIREGFGMQSVRRGNVYLLNCFVGDSAPLIFSLAGREYDGMVSCKKGDTSTSRIFKQSIENYMGYVRGGDKPGETDTEIMGSQKSIYLLTI